MATRDSRGGITLASSNSPSPKATETKTWRCLPQKPSWSPFCPKFHCHSNRGRSRVDTRKGEKERENRFMTGEREGEVITVDASIAACAAE